MHFPVAQGGPGRPAPGEEYGESKNTRRAIGLLVVFATILTVIVTWNIPETTGD
jgi:hypothetical protein